MQQPIQLIAVNGKATCLSTDIARHFDKQHKHVLRDIENLLAELPDSYKPNFGLTSIQVAQPNGGTRSTPAYRITRDGFTLLAMGFTGKKALHFKLAYIDAFNDMEARLHAQVTAAQPRRVAYGEEDWFFKLCSWASVMRHDALALALGISRHTLSKVLHGRDGYGRGHQPRYVAEAVDTHLRDVCPFAPRRERRFHALPPQQQERLEQVQLSLL